MISAIPVIDLRAASPGNTSQLGAVRAATEQLGALQVINHGVPAELISDLSARTARLLGLPRAEKAKLASPHPYRGWRQWPDAFGRLELERFNVAQFDDIGAARTAGLDEKYLGLYAHANVWPADDPGLREVAFRYIEASCGLAKRMLWLYAKAQGLRDTFTLGTPPHLRLTVNDYPAWAYPDAAAGPPELGCTAQHPHPSCIAVSYIWTFRAVPAAQGDDKWTKKSLTLWTGAPARPTIFPFIKAPSGPWICARSRPDPKTSA